MSQNFADVLYNLRSANATRVQIADAIDGLASGRMSSKVVTATGSESVTTEGVVFVNNSSSITLTLPLPSTCEGKVFTFVKISSNSSPATIATSGGTLQGTLKNELSVSYDYLSYVSTGVDYIQIAGISSGINSFTPTFTPIGDMAVTINTTHAATYWYVGRSVFFDIDLTLTTSGTASSWLQLNFPSGIVITSNSRPVACNYSQPSAEATQLLASCFVQPTIMFIRKVEGGNFSLDTIRVRVSGNRSRY